MASEVATFVLCPRCGEGQRVATVNGALYCGCTGRTPAPVKFIEATSVEADRSRISGPADPGRPSSVAELATHPGWSPEGDLDRVRKMRAAVSNPAESSSADD